MASVSLDQIHILDPVWTICRSIITFLIGCAVCPSKTMANEENCVWFFFRNSQWSISVTTTTDLMNWKKLKFCKLNCGKMVIFGRKFHDAERKGSWILHLLWQGHEANQIGRYLPPWWSCEKCSHPFHILLWWICSHSLSPVQDCTIIGYIRKAVPQSLWK